MTDWNWRENQHELHEFVCDELDAFLKTPESVTEISAGANTVVKLRDEQALREQESERQKRKLNREFIEVEVVKRPYLLDRFQKQEPSLNETHTWLEHKWSVTKDELSAIGASPLWWFYEEPLKDCHDGRVRVSCLVPNDLHNRDTGKDFRLPPPIRRPEPQDKDAPNHTRLENLMALVVVHDSHGEIARIIPPEHDVWHPAKNPSWYFLRQRMGQRAEDSWVPGLKAILRRVGDEPDGPCGNCQWMHNGTITGDAMQISAWRMCRFLWEQPGRTATFDELKVPIYEDADHIADGGAYGSLRREANKFFKGNGIPSRATLKKSTVSLVQEK